MAGTITRNSRKGVEAFLRKNVADEFIEAWRKLRADRDKLSADLTNFHTLWKRAYAEHCANVYDEERRANQIDEAQHTDKHVRGLWATLGIEHKAARSKICATGKWFRALPAAERDKIISQIPATKEAVYLAASHDGADLRGLLEANPIGPEATTSEFRALLRKATPQDRSRNAKRAAARVVHPSKPPQTNTKGPYRVTVICQTWEDRTALVAFTKSRSGSYSIASTAAGSDR